MPASSGSGAFEPHVSRRLDLKRPPRLGAPVGFATRLRSTPWLDSLALRIAGAYALLATVAAALSFALRDGPPWSHPAPWISLPAFTASSISATLGIGTAGVVVVGTRVAVARFAWARRLHDELQPFARGLTSRDVIVVAVLSSLGEELLFRGLLTPTVGVVASAVIFGLVHQTRGASRWVWSLWACGVGVVLASIFALTGSLLGPLLAHGIINGVNLTFLRDADR
ncbi:MAG TPA: CPBP family intramembrane glutamic endopeptidase [Byssovorax sp.]|jgi:hypothetical protein